MLTDDAKLFLRENFQSLAADDPKLVERIVLKGKPAVATAIKTFIRVFTENMEAEGGQYVHVMHGMKESIEANWDEAFRYVCNVLGLA